MISLLFNLLGIHKYEYVDKVKLYNESVVTDQIPHAIEFIFICKYTGKIKTHRVG